MDSSSAPSYWPSSAIQRRWNRWFATRTTSTLATCSFRILVSVRAVVVLRHLKFSRLLRNQLLRPFAAFCLRFHGCRGGIDYCPSTSARACPYHTLGAVGYLCRSRRRRAT